MFPPTWISYVGIEASIREIYEEIRKFYEIKFLAMEKNLFKEEFGQSMIAVIVIFNYY